MRILRAAEAVGAADGKRLNAGVAVVPVDDVNEKVPVAAGFAVAKPNGVPVAGAVLLGSTIHDVGPPTAKGARSIASERDGRESVPKLNAGVVVVAVAA